jgi:D-sedoheptulose 7-phosphate isomerase
LVPRLTAAGSDFGFNNIFARQIEALGPAGDLFIGITNLSQMAS